MGFHKVGADESTGSWPEVYDPETKIRIEPMGQTRRVARGDDAPCKTLVSHTIRLGVEPFPITSGQEGKAVDQYRN
jgi:hypothetical protein